MSTVMGYETKYWRRVANSVLNKYPHPASIELDDAVQELQLAYWLELESKSEFAWPNAYNTLRRWLNKQRCTIRRTSHGKPQFDRITKGYSKQVSALLDEGADIEDTICIRDSFQTKLKASKVELQSHVIELFVFADCADVAKKHSNNTTQYRRVRESLDKFVSELAA